MPAGAFKRAIASRTIPVFAANNKVFQVRTNIGVTFPNAQASFDASGRAGPATASWCPGQLTPLGNNPGGIPAGAYNPGCNGVKPTVLMNKYVGRLKYKRTGAQFGGNAVSKVSGTADVALNAAGVGALPCDYTMEDCQIAMATANPQTIGVGGGTWGGFQTTAGFAPNPGLFNGKVNAAGLVLSVTATGIAAGNPNAAQSWGAPWTAGKVYVTVPSTADGGTEQFSLSGSDNRVNGIGTLSLVSGNVSDRQVTGPNANRGWMNLTISNQVPGIPGANWAILALVMTMGGTALWMIRRAVTTQA
jgi:hypothetical protein